MIQPQWMVELSEAYVIEPAQWRPDLWVLSFEFGFTGAWLIPGGPWEASALTLNTGHGPQLECCLLRPWCGGSSQLLCAFVPGDLQISLPFPYPAAFVGLTCDPVTKCPGV